MNATLTVKELLNLREGVVGFALSNTLTRLLGSPELLAGQLGDRPFVEKYCRRKVAKRGTGQPSKC